MGSFSILGLAKDYITCCSSSHRILRMRPYPPWRPQTSIRQGYIVKASLHQNMVSGTEIVYSIGRPSSTIRPQPHLLTPLGPQLPMITKRITVYPRKDKYPSLLPRRSRESPLHARVPGAGTCGGSVSPTASAVCVAADRAAGCGGVADIFEGGRVADSASVGGGAGIKGDPGGESEG